MSLSQSNKPMYPCMGSLNVLLGSGSAMSKQVCSPVKNLVYLAHCNIFNWRSDRLRPKPALSSYTTFKRERRIVIQEVQYSRGIVRPA